MPDKPCTHCGGSGTEPDAAEAALAALADAIDILALGADSDLDLHRQASAARTALAAYISAGTAASEQQAARIVFLEAALRDMLGHFPERVTADELTSRFIKPEDLASWRDVLADKPGQLAADGSCKQHDFQPAPDDPQLGHLGVHHCTRCKSRWIPARGTQR